MAMAVQIHHADSTVFNFGFHNSEKASHYLQLALQENLWKFKLRKCKNSEKYVS